MGADLERDFTQFVEARTPTLFRTALGLTGDRQAAEDLLQTVLASAYLRWSTIRGGQPEAYLRRAMYLRCVSRGRLRSYNRELPVDAVPERPTGDDETARVDLRLAVRSALHKIGAKQRAIVVLRYIEDLPDDEIGRIVGCEPATVRSQLARALQRLRQLCPELETLMIQERHS
jgi:RNA polymerase sigma-70 factor (sigma-E family)